MIAPWMIKAGAYGVAILAVAGIGFLILSWRDDSKALDSCIAQRNAQIESIKQNNEASNDYQTKLSDLNARLAKRVQPARCIPVSAPCISGSSSGISGNTKQPRGLSSEYLEQIAGDLKRTAIYVKACSNYVKSTKE